MRVHDHALEAESLYAALDFPGGGLGILRRAGGEARVARRVFAHGVRQQVVRFARHRHRGALVENLHTRRGERHDLQVDARVAHVVEASFAKILQPFAHGRRTRRRVFDVEAAKAAKARVVDATRRQELAIQIE